MMKTLLGVAIGTAVYYLLFEYAIKASDDDPKGFVPLSQGLGLDDVVLGGGGYLLTAMIVSKVA